MHTSISKKSLFAFENSYFKSRFLSKDKKRWTKKFLPPRLHTDFLTVKVFFFFFLLLLLHSWQKALSLKHGAIFFSQEHPSPQPTFRNPPKLPLLFLLLLSAPALKPSPIWLPIMLAPSLFFGWQNQTLVGHDDYDDDDDTQTEEMVSENSGGCERGSYGPHIIGGEKRKNLMNYSDDWCNIRTMMAYCKTKQILYRSLKLLLQATSYFVYSY